MYVNMMYVHMYVDVFKFSMIYVQFHSIVYDCIDTHTYILIPFHFALSSYGIPAIHASLTNSQRRRSLLRMPRHAETRIKDFRTKFQNVFPIPEYPFHNSE